MPDTRLYIGGKPTGRHVDYQTREALHEWLRPHIRAGAYTHNHDHGHHGHSHDRHRHDHDGDD